MKSIYIYLVIFLAFIGCYDDKGNYDYTLLDRVTIDYISLYTSYLGDTITYTPELKFSGDTTSSNFDFEWTLFDTKKIKSRNLFYIVDTIASGTAVLRVTDKKTGASYSQHTILTTKSPYETDGFVILARGANNESILSYIRQTNNPNSGTETNYYTYKDFHNVYEEINKEALGRAPLRIMQHFHESDYYHDSETGGLWVFQGDNHSLDISGVSFEKDVLLKDQFLDGMPADLEPYDMVDMAWSSFVIGKDGKMYSRKKISQYLFNTGYFLNEPVTFEENGNTYEVNGLGVIHHRYSMGYTLLYEKNLHRFLVIMDKDQQSAGKITSPFVPSSAYESADVARIDNLGDMKMIHCGAYKWNNYPEVIRFHAILQDPNGKFYSYEFGMNNAVYSDPTVSNVKQKVLPDATQQVLSSIIGNGKTIFNTGYTDPSSFGIKQLLGYVLITHNNELWLLNRATGTITLYDTFEADITSIDTEIYNAWIAGIGLANGKFYVEEVSVPAFTNEIPRRMFSFKDAFGEEIVSVKFKNGSTWM